MDKASNIMPTGILEVATIGYRLTNNAYRYLRGRPQLDKASQIMPTGISEVATIG